MGYEMPIVCKEINLPIANGDNLTIEEYKNKYGIDLKPYLRLERSGEIKFFVPNAKINVVVLNMDETLAGNYIPSAVFDPSPVMVTGAYESGVKDATTILGTTNVNDDHFGIQFGITNGKEFTLENLIIESAF